MVSSDKPEYYIHTGNNDDYGDPLVGISRIETLNSSLLIPYPLVSLELTDPPKPIAIDGLIMPTREEVHMLTESKPRFNKPNTTLSFIDVYGEGKQADLGIVTDTVAGFVLHALKNARNHSIQVYSGISPVELDAIHAAEDKVRRANTHKVDISEPGIGTGMYL